MNFISETGNDRVGAVILRFMQDSGISTEHVNVFPDGKSPVSLAFLNERNDAEYLFYKDYPKQRLDVIYPTLAEDDIVMIGSYYALNPVLREKIQELLEQAHQQKAIIYYDLNFRANHQKEAIKLAPAIIENLEYADIVRGSRDDFRCLYNLTEADKIYKEKIKFYCPNFLYTAGADEVSLRTRTLRQDYTVPAIPTVSTVGAGDNFNAGILYGLVKLGIRHRDLNDLKEEQWNRIIHYGISFAADVCQSLDNSVSPEFAARIK